MGDYGDCLRVPGEPEDPDTLAWARQVSREVQAAHAADKNPAEKKPYDKPPREFAEERLGKAQAAHAEGRPAPSRVRGRHLSRRPVPPRNPAAEIQAVLRQYDEAVAAGDFALPDAPARAPGTCEHCGGPVGRTGGTVCQYCTAKGTEQLTAGTRYPVPELRDDHPLRQLAPPSCRRPRAALIACILLSLAFVTFLVGVMGLLEMLS